MNITKNKIFKNHKKALLLVTAVLCQLCVIPLVTNSNGNTQFSIKAVGTRVQEVQNLIKLVDSVLCQGLLRLQSLQDKMVVNSGMFIMNYNNFVRDVFELNRGSNIINVNSEAAKSTAKLLGSADGSISENLNYSKMVIPMLSTYVLLDVGRRLLGLLSADNDITDATLTNAVVTNLTNISNHVKSASEANGAGAAMTFVEHMKLLASAVRARVDIIKAIKGNGADASITNALDESIEPLLKVISYSAAAVQSGGHGSVFYNNVVNAIKLIKTAVLGANANDSSNLDKIFTRTVLYAEGNNAADGSSVEAVAGSLPRDILDSTHFPNLQNSKTYQINCSSGVASRSPVFVRDVRDFAALALSKIFAGPCGNDQNDKDIQIFPTLKMFLPAPGNPAVEDLSITETATHEELGGTNAWYTITGNTQDPAADLHHPARDVDREFNNQNSKTSFFAFADLKNSAPILRLFMTYFSMEDVYSFSQDSDAQNSLFNSYASDILGNDDMNHGINSWLTFRGRVGVRNNPTVPNVLQGGGLLYPLTAFTRRKAYAARSSSMRNIYKKYLKFSTGNLLANNALNNAFIGSRQTNALKTVADSLRTEINTKAGDVYNLLRGVGGPVGGPLDDQQLQALHNDIQNPAVANKPLEFWEKVQTYANAKALTEKYPNFYDNNQYFKIIDSDIQNNSNLLTFDVAPNTWKITGIAQGQDTAFRTVWDGLSQAKRLAFRAFGPGVFDDPATWPDEPNYIPGPGPGSPSPIPQQYQNAHATIQAVPATQQSQENRVKKFWGLARENGGYTFAETLANHYPQYYNNTTFLKNVDALITQYNMTPDATEQWKITGPGTITVQQFQALEGSKRLALRVRGSGVFTANAFPEPSPQQIAQHLHNQISALTNDDEKSREYWSLLDSERAALRNQYANVYATDPGNLYDNFLKPEIDAGYIVRSVVGNNRWELVQAHANTLKGLWDSWSQYKKEAAKLFAPYVFNNPIFSGTPVPDGGYTTGMYLNQRLTPSQFNSLTPQRKQSIRSDASYGFRFAAPEYRNYDPNYALNDVDIYKDPLDNLRRLVGTALAQAKKEHPVYGFIIKNYIEKTDTQITRELGNLGLNLREYAAKPSSFRAASSSFTRRQLEDVLYKWNINFRCPPFVSEDNARFSGMSQQDLEKLLDRKSILGYGDSVKNAIERRIDDIRRDRERKNYGGSYGSEYYDEDPWSANVKSVLNFKKLVGASVNVTKYVSHKAFEVIDKDLVSDPYLTALIEVLGSRSGMNRFDDYASGIGGVSPGRSEQDLQMCWSALVMFGYQAIFSNIDVGKVRVILQAIVRAMNGLLDQHDKYGGVEVLSDDRGGITNILNVFKNVADDGDISKARQDLDKMPNVEFILGSKAIYTMSSKYVDRILSGGLNNDDVSNIQSVSEAVNKVNAGVTNFWRCFKDYIFGQVDGSKLLNNGTVLSNNEWWTVKSILSKLIEKVVIVHRNMAGRAVVVVKNSITGTEDRQIRKAVNSTSFSDSLQSKNISTLVTLAQERYRLLKQLASIISSSTDDGFADVGLGSGEFGEIRDRVSSFYSNMKEAISSAAEYFKRIGQEAESIRGSEDKDQSNYYGGGRSKLTIGTGEIVTLLEKVARACRDYFDIFGSGFFDKIPVEGSVEIFKLIDGLLSAASSHDKLQLYVLDYLSGRDNPGTVNVQSLDLSNYFDSNVSYGDGDSSTDSMASRMNKISKIFASIDKDNAAKLDAARGDAASVDSATVLKDANGKGMKLTKTLLRESSWFKLFTDMVVRPLYDVLNSPVNGEDGKAGSLKDFGFIWDVKKTPAENLAANIVNFIDKATTNIYSPSLSNVFHLDSESLRGNKALEFLKGFASAQEKALKLEERGKKEQEAQDKEAEAKEKLEEQKREEEEKKEEEAAKKAEKKAKKAKKDKKKEKELREREEEEVLEAAKQKPDVAAQPQVQQPQQPVVQPGPESPISNYSVRGFNIDSAEMCTTANVQFNSQTREVVVEVQGLATNGDVFMDFFSNGGEVDKAQKRMSTKTGSNSAKGTYVLADNNVHSLEVQVYGRNNSPDGLGEERDNFQTRIVLPLKHSAEPSSTDARLQVPNVKDGASNPILNVSIVKEIVKMPNGTILVKLDEQALKSIKTSGGKNVSSALNLIGVIVPDNGNEKAKICVYYNPKTGENFLLIPKASGDAMGIGAKKFEVHFYDGKQTGDNFVMKFEIDPNAIIQPAPAQQAQVQQVQPAQQAQIIEKPAKEVEEVLKEKVSKSKPSKKQQYEADEDDADEDTYKEDSTPGDEDEDVDLASADTDDEDIDAVAVDKEKRSALAEAIDEAESDNKEGVASLD